MLHMTTLMDYFYSFFITLWWCLFSTRPT